MVAAPGGEPSARSVVDALEHAQSDVELAKVRKRLDPDDPAIGVRMGELFEIAKANTELPIAEVHVLLDHPAYEPRMAAMCILDFKARGRLDDDERRALYDVYLGRHDRITTWDMVDRSAPRVVGGYLTGRSMSPLFDLAASSEPLRRRSAMTAPLLFTRNDDAEGLATGFEIAGLLASDAEPVVHNAVGIFLKHAGQRDPDALRRCLDERAPSMARPALRLALEKSDPAVRKQYLS